jgi:hypothetical protein
MVDTKRRPSRTSTAFCGPGRLEGENKARGPHLNQIKLPGRRKRARSEEGFARADAAMSARMLPPRTGIHDRPMLRPKEQAPPPGNPLQRRLGLKPQHWREGAHAIRSGRSSAGSRCRGVVSRKCERHNRITRPQPDAGLSARLLRKASPVHAAALGRECGGLLQLRNAPTALVGDGP